MDRYLESMFTELVQGHNCEAPSSYRTVINKTSLLKTALQQVPQVYIWSTIQVDKNLPIRSSYSGSNQEKFPCRHFTIAWIQNVKRLCCANSNSNKLPALKISIRNSGFEHQPHAPVTNYTAISVTGLA